MSRRVGVPSCPSTCLALALLAVAPAAAEVRWQSGAVSDPRLMSTQELRAAFATLAARAERSRVILHFDGPVDPARRAALEAKGVTLLGYLGGHAFFATLPRNADPAAVSEIPGIVAVEAIEPSNKLHPDLAAGIVREWSVVRVPEAKDAAADPIVAVYLLLHPDADLTADAPQIVRRHAGEIRSYIHAIHGAVVHLPMSRVGPLAAEDPVMWVEPPLPALVEFNDSNRTRVGANTLADPPYGLDGSGIDVLVYDGGKIFQHGDLAGRLTIGVSDTAGVSDHATHVACTVAGNGAASGGTFRGMAPAADVISYGFEQEGGLQQGFLYTDPGDMEADYTEAITLYGADLSNNSIGTNTAANGFPCEWEGNYGATGALIDELARGSTGNPFRIVWANGNERGPGTCGATYHTTAPPACAKNHITVGALDSDTDGVTSFTSWGPCDDGRLKPDVSAPGCQAGVDFGVTSCSSGGGYTVKCGTSMASPTAAGVSALLLQQFRTSYPGAPDPRNSTLKTILAQTAQDLVTPGPDYQTGYGSIRAVAAADLVREGRFLEAEVAQGQVFSFLVLVGPGDTELRVTLAWDDPAGTPDVNPILVNDLDLRVVAPGGATTHLPWTLDPANPAAPAVRSQRDGVNNIEQVVIDSPPPGAYTVEIEGFDVAQGPAQIFSVSASPTLVYCASAGVLGISANRVSCDTDIDIQLVDCDLNTDDGLVETATVGVTSASEPGGETVVLTETAAETAAFTGAIHAGTIDAPGTILVSDGETISVTYVDADDGAGGSNVPVLRNVVVDCRPPEITGVSVAPVHTRDATVAITADEPVRLTLSYGTSCASLTNGTASLGLDVAHQIKLAGLANETTYYFTVAAEDEAGNGAFADNGGACYSFTTLRIPDFFTEQFDAGIDLEGLSLTFTPNGSVDFYAACAEELDGALPTEPAGGANLALGDDLPGSFALGAGNTVALYGQSYGTVFVGPNGFLTFGAGDSTYGESLSQHFGLPRVAALFDDLNPATGGSVTWKQVEDRVAVTWSGVPEYSTSNSNTFQIEMFFDGMIRLSWLQIDSGDAIAGLSSGAGLDLDFSESNLSSSATCGPFPPTVENVVVSTHIGDAVAIALVGSDDGQPAPPSLVYRIASLPAFGLLSDPVAQASIAGVPFDLAGDQVVYSPYPGYGGADGFTYKADDGGTAPGGGESNLAIVAIDLTVGGPETLYSFLTDDADPGWSVTGAWSFGQPAGSGSHAGDPTSGATGVNVYGYDLGGDYANGMSPEYLTSSAIDLENAANTALEFRRWLGIEGSLHDHAALQVSTDGANWTNVWVHGGPAIDEGAWSLRSYDISAVADRKKAVRFRWVMGTTDGAVTYPGWNIDDVRISGVVVATCSAAPTEVTELKFTTEQTLGWKVGPAGGGAAPVYDTLRSGSPTDFGGGAVCLESDGADGETTDTDEPAADAVFYYLVRAENGCGPGPLGGDGNGRACEP